MQTTINALAIVVALGIFNVWLLRFGQSTRWRGGEARNMREEFAVYGLPVWFMYLVGFFKLSFASLLVATIWFPALRGLAGGGLAALMVGAVAMHLKVRDPALKSAPALCMLAMSLALALIQ